MNMFEFPNYSNLIQLQNLAYCANPLFSLDHGSSYSDIEKGRLRAVHGVCS